MSKVTTLAKVKEKSFAPETLDEAVHFSKILATSSMVPQAYRNKPADIMVAIQWGYELGLQPMQAIQNIAVINGRPSIYGDLMLALCYASGLVKGFRETIEGEGDKMVAICITQRQGMDDPVVERYSMDMAKTAGLANKDNYRKHPARMLTMRARGFALRNTYPDVLAGLITIEEAEDYPEPLDVTPPPQMETEVLEPEVLDSKDLDSKDSKEKEPKDLKETKPEIVNMREEIDKDDNVPEEEAPVVVDKPKDIEFENTTEGGPQVVEGPPPTQEKILEEDKEEEKTTTVTPTSVTHVVNEVSDTVSSEKLEALKEVLIKRRRIGWGIKKVQSKYNLKADLTDMSVAQAREISTALREYRTQEGVDAFMSATTPISNGEKKEEKPTEVLVAEVDSLIMQAKSEGLDVEEDLGIPTSWDDMKDGLDENTLTDLRDNLAAFLVEASS